MLRQTQKDEQAFKVIIAIKCVKEHSNIKMPSVRVVISIQDKSKSSSLPFNEGQFFDLKDLDVSKPITLTFYSEKENKEIGAKYIHIPESILNHQELEISDDFQFNYTDSNYEGVFRGSYYIIILNKNQSIQKQSEMNKKQVHQKNLSPNPIKQNKSPQVKKGKLKEEEYKKQKDEDLKRQTSVKKLQERVENSVKNTMKELSDLKQQQSPPQPEILTKGQTLLADLDSPARISSQIQLTKSMTIGQRGDLNDSYNQKSPSPLKIQTFNVEDSPSKKMNQSIYSSYSPVKGDNYNQHVHQNLSCLYYIDQANMSDQLKSQADYFKKIIYSLNQKIEGLKSKERTNERLLNELQRADERINQLQQLLQESQDSSKKLRTDINNNYDLAQEEKLGLLAQIRKQTDQITQLEQKNVELEYKLEQSQDQIVQMDRRLTELLVFAKQVTSQETKIDQNERIILDNLRMYENKVKELQEYINGHENQKAELQGDLNKANQHINHLKGDLIQAQNKIKELQNEIGVAERKVQVLKVQEVNAKNLQDQIGQLQKDIVELTRQKGFVEGEYDQMKKEIDLMKAQIVSNEKSFNEKQASLRQKISENEQKLFNLQNDIDQLNKTNSQLKQENKNLQQGVKLSQDILMQIDNEKKKNQLLSTQLKDSQQREKIMTENYQQANSHLLESRKQINELKIELEETRQYCSQLKKLILEMKESGVAYIPFHNDPIDKAIAEFINSLQDPERIRNLFIRESEGVYMFGQKKVYARGNSIGFQMNLVEQGRVLIKTGGGFMGIEEFFDLFVANEIERMEKTDPKKQYDQNQAIHERIDSAKVVKQYRNQQSPLRNKSPFQ